MKTNYVPLVLLAIAILVDYVFFSFSQMFSSAASINSLTTLFWLRPLVLSVFYFIAFRVSSKPRQRVSLYALLFVVLFLLLVSFPQMTYGPVHTPEALYNLLEALSTSRLGLTLHVASIIVAIGAADLTSRKI